MLPRSHRVSKLIFERTMRESKIFHSPYFTMRIGLPSDEVSRFSVVVSKKVALRATKRNSLRRKAYSAIGELLPAVKSGRVTLFFSKKGAETAAYEALKKDLQELMTRAGML